ncbi:MAG: CoA transferase, partial [Nocardioidaceae bacterium]
AGHDIDYIAVSGALHGLGQTSDRPQFPTNLLGDFGGGSTYLVIGILAALLEARSSGLGQVVDAAIVDGVAHLSLMYAGLLAAGLVTETRATGLLDGGAPFYGVYETADGRHVAVGAIEPAFWAALVEGLGLSGVPDREEPSQWPRLHAVLTERFAQMTLAEWEAIFEGTDACFAPVLSMTEAARHPHLAARRTYVERGGIVQPAPAPRFSRTQARLAAGPARPLEGADAATLLAAWGLPTPVDPA